MTLPAFKTTVKDDVKILAKKTVYEGFFRINHYAIQHRLFAGGWSQTLERAVVEKCGAACALLYDPYLDKVVLIEQFRIGALEDTESPWLIEIIAGLLDHDETPEELVVRETKEEANLEILDLHFICQYWVTPGFSSEQVTLFCAKVDAAKAEGVYGLPEEGEDIRVMVVTPEEAFEAIGKGQIKNAPTIISLQWLKLNKSMLREKWGLRG